MEPDTSRTERSSESDSEEDLRARVMRSLEGDSSDGGEEAVPEVPEEEEYGEEEPMEPELVRYPWKRSLVSAC